MTGMEDVLTAHAFIGFDHDYGELHCKCGRSLEPSDADPDSREPHAAHVAEALAVAGFGSQHDAWDEGFDDCWGYYNSEGAVGTQTNPYPKVSET